MNKRGKIEIKEILEVLLAVAGVAILTVLIIKIFSPSLSVPELTAKNYLNSLEESLKEAKEHGKSEFLMYSSEPNPYLLVYFGGGYSFDQTLQSGPYTFIIKPQKAKRNSLCICYLDSKNSFENYLEYNKEFICKDCIQKDLDYKEFFGYLSGEELYIFYSPNSKEYQITTVTPQENINIQNNLVDLINLIKEQEQIKENNENLEGENEE